MFEFCVLLVFVYPLLVLRPLLRFVAQHETPIKSGEFSMIDLLALMFLFPIPLATLQMRDVESWGTDQVIDQLVFAVLSLTIPSLVWFLGLRAANHLGVKHQWKRLVLIGFTFPAAVLGAFVLPALALYSELVTTNLVFLAVTYCVITLLAYASGVWVVHGCEPIAEA